MSESSLHRGATHVALNVLRIVTGFLFMPHGAQKLFAVLGREEAVEPMSRMWVAGTLEFYGGLLIMLGLLTRPVAFVLSGLMAFAYFIAHNPRGFWPIGNNGELAALYCFVFLFFAVAGGGHFSLDGAWAAWRRGRTGGI